MEKISTMIVSFLLVGSAVCVGQSGNPPGLKMETVMTSEELRDSGVSTLDMAQRRALDRWLAKYTQAVLRVAASHGEKSAPAPSRVGTRLDCSPAIESTISGEFEGWSGETLFKLDNGQIWEQAEYDYMYSYQYRPDVTVYLTDSGCRMKVEDEDDTILVRRIN